MRMPVLWVTGPGGAGKSTASWQLFGELSAAGIPVAFADTDQFCMCYPAPDGDPGRERLKALNLAAVLPHYHAAGARYVIANGVLDPARGVDRELLPGADVTVCRLRVEPDELVRRLTGRCEPDSDLAGIVAESLDEASAMDASSFADVCIDTTEVAAADVAALIRGQCPDWPGFRDEAQTGPGTRSGGTRSGGTRSGGTRSGGTRSGGTRSGGTGRGGAGPCAADGAGGEVLLISGPAGVGKSAIGFQVYLRQLGADLTAAYVDLDQLAFVRPPAGDDPGAHRLKAASLAAMWRNYRAAGATHLVATGPVGSQAAQTAYASALAGATLTVVRLHADRAELAQRIMTRADGGSWPEPGDALRGQPAAFLRQVADRAAADDGALERAGVGDVRVDTTGRTAAGSADLIAGHWARPGRA